MNAEQSHLQTGPADLSRLQLAIQRLLDADLLLEEEAAPLLACMEAGGHSQEQGHPDDLQGLQERLVTLINGLNSPNPLDVLAAFELVGRAPESQSKPSAPHRDPALGADIHAQGENCETNHSVGHQ